MFHCHRRVIVQVDYYILLSILIFRGGGDCIDLHVDYWCMTPRSDCPERDRRDKKDGSSKYSLKTSFRSLVVGRMGPGGGAGGPFPGPTAMPAFSMAIATKDKKQKSISTSDLCNTGFSCSTGYDLLFIKCLNVECLQLFPTFLIFLAVSSVNDDVGHLLLHDPCLTVTVV